MKKFCFLILMASALALITGCDKNKGGGSDEPTGGGFVINATVVDGDDYNDEIATVKAEMENDEEETFYIASGKYANGGFKLTLPNNVSEKHLYAINETFDDFDGTISDPNAKIGAIWISAFDENGKLIGEFYQEYDGDDEGIEANYLYVDRKVIVKGYDDELEFDCSFKKGWNIVYGIETDEGGKITTQKPSGVNLKWYYYYFKDDKSTPDKNITKLQQPFFKNK